MILTGKGSSEVKPDFRNVGHDGIDDVPSDDLEQGVRCLYRRPKKTGL